MSMPEYAKASVHRILSGVVHLLVSGYHCEEDRLPPPLTYFVYSENMGWGDRLLKGKRVRVEITVEDVKE